MRRWEGREGKGDWREGNEKEGKKRLWGGEGRRGKEWEENREKGMSE